MCTRCHFRGDIYSELKTDRVNIGDAAVEATISSGMVFAQFQEFLNALDIPPMTERTFRRKKNILYESYLKAAEESMKRAGEVEFQLAVARGDIRNGLPCIKVVADGCWTQRSYQNSKFNSNSGFAVIMGYHTRKVLFYGVRNKYCYACRVAENKGESPRKHACFRNHTDSSSSMEAHIILEGFKSSIEQHGLIYEYLVAGGDSSVYNAIQQANPYVNPSVLVKKIVCINHLLRSATNNLKKVGPNKKGVSAYKRLIQDNLMRIRNAVHKAIDYRDKEVCLFKENVNRLKGDIINIPKHVFGDHIQCADYFCTRKPKENEINCVPDMEDNRILEEIQNAMKRLRISLR